MISKLLFVLLTSAVSAEWPDCIKEGVDHSDLSVVKNFLVVSADMCALKCQENKDQCRYWVYDASNWHCILKSVASVEDNETSNNETVSNDNNEETMAEEKGMNTSFSGDLSCFPIIKEPWPDCVVQGRDLSGNAAVLQQQTSEDESECSLRCGLSPDCEAWQFNLASRICSLSASTNEESVSANDSSVLNGNKHCIGRVLEEGDWPVDGGWSPWSTLSPMRCFDAENNLDAVACGGGVVIRVRSCSNPQPRMGGRVCTGPEWQYHPCNQHDCRLLGPLGWSQWSEPSPHCGQGFQSRETMCGLYREKGSGKVIRRSSRVVFDDFEKEKEPWPNCLSDVVNSAPPLSSSATIVVESCTSFCQENENCTHWTLDLAEKKCFIYSQLQLGPEGTRPNFVSGSRQCFMSSESVLPAPYCGEYNRVSDAQPHLGPFNVGTNDGCAKQCAKIEQCSHWMLTIDSQGVRRCSVFAETSSLSSSALNDSFGLQHTFLGSNKCLAQEESWADLGAVEVMHKHVCTHNQNAIQKRAVNTWNRTTCRSPCERVGACPAQASCEDVSDAIMAKVRCECRFGLHMYLGECVEPISNEIEDDQEPKFDKDQEGLLKVIINAALVIFVGLTSFSLLLHLSTWSPEGRFMHFNIELSLILAHLILLMQEFDLDEMWCRRSSIFLHLLFNVAFIALLLEALNSFGFVAFALKRGSMLSRLENVLIAYGSSILIVCANVAFQEEYYGNCYRCWINYGHQSLVMGQMGVVVVALMVVVVVAEAAGAIDPNSVTKLDDTDETRLAWASASSSTLVLRTLLLTVAFVSGSSGMYNKAAPVLALFVVADVGLAIAILVGHARASNKALFGGFRGRAPTSALGLT